jgi:hypothetical protein
VMHLYFVFIFIFLETLKITNKKDKILSIFLLLFYILSKIIYFINIK